MVEKYQQELFSFLEEYADFLAYMVRDEEEKLASLLSNSLPRIEKAIATAQANAKKMENYELRRVRLQEQAGFGGATFSEIVECAPEEEQQSLDALLQRIQSTVETIKYHNTKSMNVARTNMMERNPGAELPGTPKSAAGSAYRKAGGRSTEQHSMLETKI